MFIQTESTPNPATLKFLPGQSVLDAGTADFPSAEAATKSPLAARIFGVDGVTGVLIPPEDPRAMSRAIEDLSNDVNLMSGMGALGRQRALQHFSQSTTNGQIGMIFQTAC